MKTCPYLIIRSLKHFMRKTIGAKRDIVLEQIGKQCKSLSLSLVQRKDVLHIGTDIAITKSSSAC